MRVLSYGRHEPADERLSLVEAACAHAEPERVRTDAPGWAPVLEGYAQDANDAYGVGVEADARRTAALSWAIEAIPRADRSVAAEQRRAWLVLAWALADVAEALDAAGVEHDLWRLAIPADRWTTYAGYNAIDRVARRASATVVTASSAAARAARAAADAYVVVEVALGSRTSAFADAEYPVRAAARAARATVCAADTTANAAARWAWLDARMPARLRVLCEVRG